MSARVRSGTSADDGAGAAVTIRGGSAPTVLEAASVLLQAGVLHAVARGLEDAAARCRGAAFGLDVLGPHDFRGAAAWPVLPGALVPGAGPGPAGLTGLTGWPAHVRSALDATLQDLRVAAAAAGDAADRLHRVAARMRQAVTLHEEAQSTALGHVLAAAYGPGPAVLAPATVLVPLAWLVGSGLAGVVTGALGGQGWSPARAVTASDPLHEPAVTWLSSWVGLADVDRPWWRPPGPGDAASVLGGVTASLRGRPAAVARVERVATPDGVVLATPSTLDDALAGVEALYGRGGTLPSSVLAVQRFRHDDGTVAWLVSVPGTQTGTPGTVFSMASNFALMDDDVARRVQADSAQAVLAAMADAGIAPDDEVLIVGHSQGGLVGATVAAATVGRYRVTHVATAGAPVAAHPLPPPVRGTHVETRGEGVSALDGAPNPATARRVTVTGDLAVRGAAPADVPHGVPFHRRTLAAAGRVGDRGLDEHLRAIEEHLSGTADEPQLYRALLVAEGGETGTARATGQSARARPVPCTAPGALPLPADPWAPTGVTGITGIAGPDDERAPTGRGPAWAPPRR